MDGRPLPPTLRTVALALAALAIASTGAQAQVRGCGSAAQTRAAHTARSDLAILCLVNAERARHRLAPLRFNASLSNTARRHSAQMVAARYFSHDGPRNSTLVTRVRGTRYLRHARAYALAETLAFAGGGQASPAGLIALLMASPEHRAILMSSAYRDIGVGISSGAPIAGTSGATLTLDLGHATR
jgi:uncharacterized protein YkwD